METQLETYIFTIYKWSKLKDKSNLTTHASKMTQVPHILICEAPPGNLCRSSCNT